MRAVACGLTLSALLFFRADIVTAAGPRVETPPDATWEREDYDQVLREGFELLDGGHAASAAAALQLLVVRADAPTLERVEALCRELRGRPLDAVLAEARLSAAEARRVFNLGHVTRYEARALGELLEARLDALLAARHAGRDLAGWAAAPGEHELSSASRRLVEDARLAAALATARLRHDPRLVDRGERQRLSRLAGEMARLAAAVSARPGYTALLARDDATDPTRREADRIAREQPAPTEDEEQP